MDIDGSFLLVGANTNNAPTKWLKRNGNIMADGVVV